MKKADGDEHPKDDVNAASLKPSRRQFLKGLTTGTVAIGALTGSGCAPAVPPLKTRGATNTNRA